MLQTSQFLGCGVFEVLKLAKRNQWNSEPFSEAKGSPDEKAKDFV